MLLSKKAKPNLQSDWAVILNRAVTDFAKQRAAEQLISLFQLSPEEAGDLMANTPIVLLDQISLDVAEKVREHFSKIGVDCSATNDIFQKRKCFRAIWPETPDVSRFMTHSLSRPSEEEPTSSFQLADKPQAPAQKEKREEPAKIQKTFLPEPSVRNREEAELKTVTLELQRENEILKRELERSDQTAKSKSKSEEEVRAQIRQFQAEQTRLEETLKRLRDENTILVARTKDSERGIGHSQQEKLTLSEGSAKTEVSELRAQLEHLRGDYIRVQTALRAAQGEAKQFQHEWTDAQKMLSESRAECEDLKRMLDQAQTNCIQLKEEVDQSQSDIDDQLRAQRAELEEWKRKAGDWSAGYAKVIKENEFLRAHQAEELESLRARNRELGEQLEQVQRQNREFGGQLEQQKLIQKRTRAAHDLSEKEIRLKELVQKQQALEQEIRSREDDMKNVLQSQEEVEREIVKLKQTQKYMMEQSKIKEKPRFGHQRTSLLPPHDPGFPESTDDI